MSLTSEPRDEQYRLCLRSDPGEIERLAEWVTAFCEEHSLSPKFDFELNLILEEVVINAVKHGQCDASTDAIQVSLQLAPGELLVHVSDNGIAFNPTLAGRPDLSGAIRDRQIGGLGLHLVKNLTQAMEYERRQDRNHLFLRKRLE